MTDLSTLAGAAQAHATLAHTYAREGNLRKADEHRKTAARYLDDLDRVIAEGAAITALDARVHPEGAPADPAPPLPWEWSDDEFWAEVRSRARNATAQDPNTLTAHAARSWCIGLMGGPDLAPIAVTFAAEGAEPWPTVTTAGDLLEYLTPAPIGGCTCTQTHAATHLEPAEWEQDPDCPVHPMSPPPAGPAWALRWLYTEGPFLMLTHEHARTLVDVVVRLRQSAGYATLITDLDTIAAANIPGIDGSAEATIIDQVLDAALNLTDASLMVATERRRQIDVEGYRPEHDLAHQPGELAAAAGCYLLAADSPHGDQLPVPGAWPWAPEYWKPSDARSRNLTKAAALVVAELDAELTRERLIAEEDAQLAGAASDAEQAEDAQGRAEHDAAQSEPPPDAGYQGEEPF